MGVQVTVAIVVAGMDGEKLIEVLRSETALNLNPKDGQGEALVALATLDTLVASAHETAKSQLGEIVRILERNDR